MSSVFLLVGIVAVWFFFLVPRWLRRHHAAAQLDLEHTTGPPGDLREDEDWEAAGTDADGVADEDAVGSVRSEAMAAGADGQYATSAETVSRSGPADKPGRAARATAGGPAQGQAVRRPTPPRPLTRSRVLAARRRILLLLLLLTAAVGTCAYLKITTWWTFIPPVGMLSMYLLLLREASVADAEQARLRADAEWRAEVARERAYAAQEAEAEAAAATDYVQYEQRTAEVIDISGRVGDQLYDQYAGEQLYDQYADAAIRAVGD